MLLDNSNRLQCNFVTLNSRLLDVLFSHKKGFILVGEIMCLLHKGVNELDIVATVLKLRFCHTFKRCDHVFNFTK